MVWRERGDDWELIEIEGRKKGDREMESEKKIDWRERYLFSKKTCEFSILC